MNKLATVQAQVRACTLCAAHLPLGPRPIVRGKQSAKLLIISQAPGTKVHTTGLFFNDRSGDRLRDWLGIDRETFYDEARIAIMGMGFCYPGVNAKGGDLPPRKECPPLWHPKLLPLYTNVEPNQIVGSYAVNHYLPHRQPMLSETVEHWRDYGPRFIPLPHPSWRNTGWLKTHPWFEKELVPALRKRVAKLI